MKAQEMYKRLSARPRIGMVTYAPCGCNIHPSLTVVLGAGGTQNVRSNSDIWKLSQCRDHSQTKER